MKRLLVETSPEPIKLNIDEAATEVDGKYILAKVKGPFFIPDGVSRNERFYPKDLWEQVCASQKLQEQLKQRNMFGCIAHETPLTDESWRDGKFSHIVTKFGIDENGNPDCEAVILNTPSGQILNTCIRAGSKVYVSTRADGDFNGTTDEGIPIVDKDSYDFQTVDFVLRPGFLKANPKLEESLVHQLAEITHKQKNEGNNMTLEEALKMIEDLTKKNLKVSEEADKAKEDTEAAKAELEVVKKENGALKDENGELKKVGEAFTKFKKIIEAETEEIAAQKASELKNYQTLGKPEDAQAAINKAKEFDELTKDLGATTEIKESFAVLEAISVKYKKLMEDFGSEDNIEKMSDEFETVVAKKEEEKENAKKEALAKKLGVKKSVIEKLLEKKMTLEAIENTMAALKEENMVNPEDVEVEDEDEEVVESEEANGDEETEEEGDEDADEEDEDSYAKDDNAKEVIEHKVSKKNSTSRLFESML